MSLDVDLIPFLILLSIFLTTRIRKSDTSENYLSKENSSIMRGFSALRVIFLHISRYYRGGLILPLFFNLGRSAVGTFYFLSSYGMMKQHIKDENYHKAFVKKRFTRVIIPYSIITAVYWVFLKLINSPVTIIETIISILQGHPIVTYSWYILEILILYLFFALAINTFKKDYDSIVVYTTILSFSLMEVFRLIGQDPQWYLSIHMFAVGTLLATYEERIIKALKKYYFWFLCIGIVAGLITINFRNDYNIIFYQEPITILLCILFLLRFSIKSPILTFIGDISMEVYLMQGLCIRIVRVFINSDNQLACIFLTFLLTVIFAKILNNTFKFLFNKLFKNIF